MKTICAALGMAALLTFSASADTLTLPKGHVLDFGDTVDILDGRQTYFGKQMKNWAEHEAVEKESKPQAAAIGIIGGADGPAAVYLDVQVDTGCIPSGGGSLGRAAGIPASGKHAGSFLRIPRALFFRGS